mmetsp:Transcript_47356/g.125383  ORF Transcript_47356/g.125383 Transcript_47356/m.125383 type:complete len:414 (+) Transcript_47356:22-1263(+)
MFCGCFRWPRPGRYTGQNDLESDPAHLEVEDQMSMAAAIEEEEMLEAAAATPVIGLPVVPTGPRVFRQPGSYVSFSQPPNKSEVLITHTYGPGQAILDLGRFEQSNVPFTMPDEATGRLLEVDLHGNRAISFSKPDLVLMDRDSSGQWVEEARWNADATPVAMDPAGKMVASRQDRTNLTLHPRGEKTFTHVVPARIDALAVCETGSHVLAGLRTGDIVMCSVVIANGISAVSPHTVRDAHPFSSVTALAWAPLKPGASTPAESTVASGAYTHGSINIYRFRRGALEKERELSLKALVQLEFCRANTDLLGSASRDNCIRLWRISTGAEIWRVDVEARVQRISLSFDCHLVAALVAPVDADREVMVWGNQSAAADMLDLELQFDGSPRDDITEPDLLPTALGRPATDDAPVKG